MPAGAIRRAPLRLRPAIDQRQVVGRHRHAPRARQAALRQSVEPLDLRKPHSGSRALVRRRTPDSTARSRPRLRDTARRASAAHPAPAARAAPATSPSVAATGLMWTMLMHSTASARATGHAGAAASSVERRQQVRQARFLAPGGDRLARVPASGSLGCQSSAGNVRAKCTACSPVPLATSSTSPARGQLLGQHRRDRLAIALGGWSVALHPVPSRRRAARRIESLSWMKRPCAFSGSTGSPRRRRPTRIDRAVPPACRRAAADRSAGWRASPSVSSGRALAAARAAQQARAAGCRAGGSAAWRARSRSRP